MGKTTLVEMCGRLVGGIFDLQPDEKADAFKKRLLTPAAATKRVVLCDNVKTSRFSWAELEALITSWTISGHRMYFGEGNAPQYVHLGHHDEWRGIIKRPGAEVHHDQAGQAGLQRHMERGNNRVYRASPLEHHRRRSGILCLAGTELAKASRWSAWESAVLARLPEPNEAQAVILERQAECNVDDEESMAIEDYFCQRLERLGYDPDADHVHIPNDVACQWWRTATQSNAGPTMVTRMVKQGSEEGSLMRLTVNRCRTHGRGLLWVGGPSTTVAYDVPERIKQYASIGTSW